MKKATFILLAILFAALPKTAWAKEYFMGYLYNGATRNYIEFVDRCGEEIDAAAPCYMDIDDMGNLTLNAPGQEFVSAMHKRNLKVIPVLTNHFDKEAGEAALDKGYDLALQIVGAVQKYGFDGVNVDIENVSHLHRQAYVEFVRVLKEKLGEEKTVAVSVAPNPYNWHTGWHGSYDYKGLANCADYLVIMGYDQSFYGSEPGPVASGDFVEKSIQYGLKYVAPEKLVLGIPFYGRYWNKDNTIQGLGIAQMDVKYLLKEYNNEGGHNTDHQSAKAVMNIPGDGQASPQEKKQAQTRLWGGAELAPGEYEIWYDDIKATVYKLELVEKYNLKGYAAWALGQEDPEIWAYIRHKRDLSGDILADGDLQNGRPSPVLPSGRSYQANKGYYTDISGHFAQKSIERLKEKGIMDGKDGVFAPDGEITRAEMIAAVVACAGDLPKPPVPIVYKGMENHWAKDYFSIAAYNHIIPREMEEACPDAAVTREEFALLADKVFKMSNGINFHETPFQDVAWESHPKSFYAILKLYENQIARGYEDNTFRPDHQLTKGEAAVMIDRLSKFGIRTLPPVKGKDFFSESPEDVIYPR